MARLRATAVLAGTLLLGGCNAGLYLTLGPVDNPPSVSLAASPAVAAPGDSISLVAAATDDYRVVEVAFYRVDVGGSTLLGRDSGSPYAFVTTIPAGASGAVTFFARATDDAGQVGQSQAITVLVH
jgi:hypothetical protein